MESDPTYLIDTVIGEGSFGAVNLATDRRDGRRVALKRLYGNVAPHRVVNEIEQLTAASEGAGHLVPELMDAHHSPLGGFVIVMEYFEHDDWKSYYNKLSWQQLQLYMQQLMSALAHVHSRGVIHRDIKPRNFLFNLRSGQGCLVDFGLAQSCQLWKERSLALSRHRQALANRANSSSSSSSSSRRGRRRTDASNNHTSSLGASCRVNSSSNQEFERHRVRGSKRSLDLARVAQSTTAQRLRRCTVKSTETKAKRPEARAEVAREDIVEAEQVSSAAVGGAVLPRRPERGGTPGFRAPEVLLFSMEQTTAIDIWSAGIVFLSLICRRYPFFHAGCDRSDEMALLQIASLLGVEQLKAAAESLRTHLELPCAKDLMWEGASPHVPLIVTEDDENSNHRRRSSGSSGHANSNVSESETLGSLFDEAFQPISGPKNDVNIENDQERKQNWRLHREAEELAYRILELTPHKRASATEALQMPFIATATPDDAMRCDEIVDLNSEVPCRMPSKAVVKGGAQKSSVKSEIKASQ